MLRSRGGIAQLVEYRSPKPWVVGSNPSAPAKKSKSIGLDIFFPVFSVPKTVIDSGKIALLDYVSYCFNN